MRMHTQRDNSITRLNRGGDDTGESMWPHVDGPSDEHDTKIQEGIVG